MVLPTKQILLSGIPSFFRFRTPLSSVTKSRSERRSEEHTSELQSRLHLVCRLLLEKKKKNKLRSLSRSNGPFYHMIESDVWHSRCFAEAFYPDILPVLRLPPVTVQLLLQRSLSYHC